MFLNYYISTFDFLVLLLFFLMKWLKLFYYIYQSTVVAWRESSSALVWVGAIFIIKHKFNRKNDRKTMVNKTWIFHGHFLENELSKTVMSKDSIATIDKIQVWYQSKIWF